MKTLFFIIYLKKSIKIKMTGTNKWHLPTLCNLPQHYIIYQFLQLSIYLTHKMPSYSTTTWEVVTPSFLSPNNNAELTRKHFPD